MNRRSRMALSAAVIAAAVVAASSATSMARTTKPAAAKSTTQFQTVDLLNSPQTVFTPIRPCRIVDTRAGGGAMAGGHARAFVAIGTTGFTGQGGKAGGCGIPPGTTALDTILQTVNSTGTGFINETPDGTAFANSSLLHYVAGQVIGSGATLPINPVGTFAFDLRPSSHHTDVLVDVVGYYSAPFAAGVSSNGVLGTHSAGVISAARGGGNPTGVYVVTFASDVTGCLVQATPATTGYVLVTAVVSGTTATIVGRAPGTGALADTPVNISLTC